MQDTLEGLGDVNDGVQVGGDGLIEAKLEVGEVWVGAVIVEVK